MTEIVALLFAGFFAGFGSALWIWRHSIPLLQENSDDPSVAERIRRVQEPDHIEIDEPIPFRAIDLDANRSGFEVTDSDGRRWFTTHGISWHALPLYETLPLSAHVDFNRKITDFLLRAGVPNFGYDLTQFIRRRGGRIEFVPKPQHEPASSGHAYR
jgi:hypothetical protein